MFGRNQSLNGTGLIAFLLLNFRRRSSANTNRPNPSNEICPDTLGKIDFRKECSMISSIKPSPFWHKDRFQVSYPWIMDHDEHLNRIRVPWCGVGQKINPAAVFWESKLGLTTICDSDMDFPRSRSPDISKTWWFHFMEPYKLNWKLFNVLSKMTKRIKLMQWIYYLVTWKIKMIPDIKIGDYWSGRFFKSVTTIESTN